MAGNAAGAVISREGWQVTGSKTTQDGVEAARMCGIDGYPLRLEPQLVCDADDLDALMNVDALVITLPARRSGRGGFYLQAVQEIVDSALAHHIPRIVFTSSTSVYGNVNGTVKENSARPANRQRQVLKELEDWLHNLPGTRWIFCVWPGWWGLPVIRDVFCREVGAGRPAWRQSGAS
jgi:nucleoside-diphosphate-sugar epimerase